MPARAAGQGASRPRVAVSAEGNAVATWARDRRGGRSHVMARRLTGLTPSSFPQDLTLDSFEGAAGRQRRLAGHRHRGRRLVRLGRVPPGRGRPLADRGAAAARLAVRGPVRDRRRASRAPPRGSTSTGKGIGGAVAAADGNAVFSAYLDKFDAFQPATRLDATPSSAAPAPVVATSERGDVYAAWRTGAGESGDVRARRKDGEKGFEPEFVASGPQYGAVAPGQVAIGADRSGNTVVAMLQGLGARPPHHRRGLRPPARQARSCSARSATAPASR